MRRPVHVMHVSYSLDTGGAEVVILDLLRRLDRRRFRPSVCSFQVGGTMNRQFADCGVPIFEVQKREGKDWALLFKLWRLFLRERVDIVHCHNSAMWLYAAVPARLAGVKGLILTEHAMPTRLSRLFVTAARPLQRLTSLITVNSAQVGAFLTGTLGLSGHGIKLILNGIDLARFDEHSAIDATAKKRSLGLPDRGIVIGMVARLDPIKDHRTLLHAFSRVLVRIPNAHLLIVGSGEMDAALRDEAARLSLGERALFLGNRNDVRELLGIMDVFVLSSRKEGQSVAITEAMATRVPVVATNVGGTPELVLDGRTGLLVPPGDPEAMAAAIVRVLNDSTLAKQLCAAARKRLEQEYDIMTVVRQYEAEYATALNDV
jgi:sugar transferase (PEP-CTERM/EpsH1 system associated)